MKPVYADEDVSFVIPVAGQQGLFAIGLGTTLSSLRWNLNEKTFKVVGLATVDHNKAGNRWNDAKADINGYLWAGKLTLILSLIFNIINNKLYNVIAEPKIIEICFVNFSVIPTTLTKKPR